MKFNWLDYYAAPGIGVAEYHDERVCLFVCSRAYSRNYTCPIFT